MMFTLFCLLGLTSLSLACDFSTWKTVSRKLCYDYNRDSRVSLKCVPTDWACPADDYGIVGYALSDDCGEVQPEGFYRCVSSSTGVRRCRPIELGCRSDEIMQPGESSNKMGFISLRIIFDSMELCESLEPNLRCAADYSVDGVNDSMCISDLEGCGAGRQRVPSDRLFTDTEECINYNPHAYMQCVPNGQGDTYCSEYDENSLNFCGKKNYYRRPAHGVYDNGECSNVDYYNLCWTDANGLACEKGGLCTPYPPNNPVKFLFDTQEGCFSYEPEWARWIALETPGFPIECRPISDVIGLALRPASGGPWFRWPPEKVFASVEECILTISYVRCYNEPSNLMYCTDSASQCDTSNGDTMLGDYNTTTGLLPFYETWGECMLVMEFNRCLDLLTAGVTCRPSQAPCSSTEQRTSVVVTNSSDSCAELSNTTYLYCYDASEPMERQCVKDSEGCKDPATPLRDELEVVIFDSMSSCETYEPMWVLCANLDSSSATCRPEGATLPSDNAPCEPTENPLTTFADIPSCFVVAENWPPEI